MEEPLHSVVLSAISGGAPLPDERFNELALAIFRHQYGCNGPYRAFCDRRGVGPEGVSHWLEIPAVPTDAFKAVPLVCGDPTEAVTVFRTSGTTAGAQRRGEHYLFDLAPYHAALRAGFAAHLLPGGERLPMLSLIPPPEELTDSSLSHMVGEVMREYGAEGSRYLIGPSGLQLDALAEALGHAESTGERVCLLGTSFAFVHALDALEEQGARFSLPAGSRIMDTGGFKGRSREVTRSELYGAFADRFGTPPEWCVNEYGMTEMSSQFYDTVAGKGGARRYRPPSWVRTVAVDPETLDPLPPGETGVLRHWDLANLDSVMALQTADLGQVHEDGFEVFGRARGAEARGCSLAMDEVLSALGDL